MKSKLYDDVSDPGYFYLKDFQSRRLRETYKDFVDKPGHQAATFFFFNRLYSTEDTSERDAAFKKIYATAKRFLGGEVVNSMAGLIELQEITLAMDQTLLRILADRTPGFDEIVYEEAYAQSDNYQLRLRQIELLDLTIRLVFKISHRFGIKLVLTSLRSASILIGDTRMVDFLMDGYKAFAHLKDIEPLATAVVTRETARLDRIYGRNDQSPW